MGWSTTKKLSFDELTKDEKTQLKTIQKKWEPDSYETLEEFWNSTGHIIQFKKV